MEILPHEITALRRAIAVCIRAEKPITAQIVLDVIERAQERPDHELRRKIDAMPREE